jgi:hypothetical protein
MVQVIGVSEPLITNIVRVRAGRGRSMLLEYN